MTMKKIYLLILLLVSSLGIAQVVTTNPSPPVADGPVTLFFNKAGTPLATYTGVIYAHIGLTVNGVQWQNVKGTWGNNTTQPALTLVSGTTYKLDITPDLYTYFGVPTTSTITQICVVFRAATGAPQSTDYFINVGAFQITSLSPAENSNSTIDSNSNLPINATASLAANWNLTVNGTSVATASNTTTFSYNHTMTGDASFQLTATDVATGEIITKSFNAITTPVVQSQAIPAGIIQGINYSTDLTKATVALYAPLKSYVHVIGSFNNWQLSNSYLMKRDTANPDLYWLEISGLTPGQYYTFQYRTNDGIKVADPYSHLVLSPYDDPFITDATYPNMPEYPAGQSFEVTVLQTNQTPYNWQVPDFQKPSKESLIIYEVLIRDFTAQQTWTSLSEKIEYFKGLNINAIQLMPIMEFEGNISWGYNTAFHLAPDKAYGNADSMKAFIDLCHQNGIAVILDVALNHVYGRSPLVRLWVTDPDGDGFGNPSAQNPYCNVVPTHSYSVGSDLNHQSEATQYYTQRTMRRWMEDFNIDGFRWDLTKGFTQNCTNSETCTNAYNADRVAILKEYADYQWALDPNFYVIFEHLGVGSGPASSAAEEVEWANYRVGEGKGIMLWGKFTGQLNENTMGYAPNSTFNALDFENRGFAAPRLVGYAESHDEERLMYKNLIFGNSSVAAHNVKTLPVALERAETQGAVLLSIPGPKMIWQFGELGYDKSIFSCENGTVPTPYGNDSCKTNPKPNAFDLGYSVNPTRLEVYNTWAAVNELKLNNPVFQTTTFTINSGDLLPRIYIWNNSLPSTTLNYVVVLANFQVTPQNVTPYFPSVGTWYNLIDGTIMNVTNPTTPINIPPGQFRMYGNQMPALSNGQFELTDNIRLYPNPASGYFLLNSDMAKVEIYSMAGQLIKSFAARNGEHEFNISDLSQGIYLVKATDSSNRIKTMKLIKE